MKIYLVQSRTEYRDGNVGLFQCAFTTRPEAEKFAAALAAREARRPALRGERAEVVNAPGTLDHGTSFDKAWRLFSEDGEITSIDLTVLGIGLHRDAALASSRMRDPEPPANNLKH